jgi:hypothetical protein
LSSIPANTLLASAAAVFLGKHGDVTRLALDRQASRQSLYRQADAVAQAVEGTHTQQLQQRLDDAHAQLAQLQHQLRHAVFLTADKLAEFAATAQATGVPFSSQHVLLGVLTTQPPSVAKLGRLAHAAGRRAGPVLQVLDDFSRPKAKQVAGDEIFVGTRQVLMTIEQHSMCWLGARLAASRDGTEWAKELRQLPNAEQFTHDGAQGMTKAVELVNEERGQQQPLLHDQADHFHIAQRGQRALYEVKRKALRAMDAAAKAQKPIDRDRQQGVPLTGAKVGAVNKLWRQAEEAYQRWSRQEAAWVRLRAALRLFSPTGQLHTRPQAEQEVQSALAELTGPEWQRVRTRLAGDKVFTFLDRVQQQLEELSVATQQLPTASAPSAESAAESPVAAELVRAAVRVAGLQRQPAALRGAEPSACALRGVLLVSVVLLSLAGKAGEHAAALVHRVLSGAWRASSLVEGLNSVLRMQQARQKRLTPGLLDLKRLYWNLHQFRAGRRKGQSPYSRLGVALPKGSWWELLKIPPEQLREQLSALKLAA